MKKTDRYAGWINVLLFVIVCGMAFTIVETMCISLVSYMIGSEISVSGEVIGWTAIAGYIAAFIYVVVHAIVNKSNRVKKPKEIEVEKDFIPIEEDEAT